jgi:hypothetical protein
MKRRKNLSPKTSRRDASFASKQGAKERKGGKSFLLFFGVEGAEEEEEKRNLFEKSLTQRRVVCKQTGRKGTQRGKKRRNPLKNLCAFVP